MLHTHDVPFAVETEPPLQAVGPEAPHRVRRPTRLRDVRVISHRRTTATSTLRPGCFADRFLYVPMQAEAAVAVPVAL